MKRPAEVLDAAAPTPGDNNPTKEKESVSPAVIEAAILSIFQTDSTWHILSYLLAPKIVSKNQQRVTAVILDRVARVIQSERVLKILALMLREDRRWAVRVTLHKSILRTLFTVMESSVDLAARTTAAELLKKEIMASFGYRFSFVGDASSGDTSGKNSGKKIAAFPFLHAEIQTELVTMCMDRVFGPEGCAKAVATVEELASRKAEREQRVQNCFNAGSCARTDEFCVMWRF